MNISGHVILNFVGTLISWKWYQLESSSIHKYFLQHLVSTTIGHSLPLLYPEGMLFKGIFWKMQVNSILGALPATPFTDATKKLIFIIAWIY